MDWINTRYIKCKCYLPYLLVICVGDWLTMKEADFHDDEYDEGNNKGHLWKKWLKQAFKNIFFLSSSETLEIIP